MSECDINKATDGMYAVILVVSFYAGLCSNPHSPISFLLGSIVLLQVFPSELFLCTNNYQAKGESKLTVDLRSQAIDEEHIIDLYRTNRVRLLIFIPKEMRIDSLC